MEIEEPTESGKIGRKLAPYNPTNMECMLQAMDMLALCENDCFFDLGSGDGRFVIEAKRRFPRLRAVGVEYDGELHNQSLKNCAAAELENSDVTFLHDNVLNVDFSSASAIFIYLVPEGIQCIREKLLQLLERNARIVTYVFAIPGLAPTEIQLYKKSTKLYLYTAASIPNSTNMNTQES